jgi:hypothetical protein
MNQMSAENEFSLDDLVVDEEEVRYPVIMPVTVLVCETEYSEQGDVSDLIDNITKNLRDDYGFRTEDRRRRREGFLEVGNSDNIVKCIYAREAPMRIDYEKGDLRISTKRLRAINPSYRVLVTIYISSTKSKVVLFGGEDKITLLALRHVNYCLRGSIKGGFSTHDIAFSKEDMNKILSHFGVDIQYVFLSPGESEKLRKIAKARVRGEIKEIVQYDVRAKFAGYRVVASPVVLDLIEEGKISIIEIEGKLSFGAQGITTRVSSSGRITFFVPEEMTGRNQTAYDVAEGLYKRIVAQRSGVKQIKMEDWFSGSS